MIHMSFIYHTILSRIVASSRTYASEALSLIQKQLIAFILTLFVLRFFIYGETL